MSIDEKALLRAYAAISGRASEHDLQIAIEAYEAAKCVHQPVAIPHMPEELREAFEDYYSGAKDYDRRAAQWGFECGVFHGQNNAPERELSDEDRSMAFLTIANALTAHGDKEGRDGFCYSAGEAGRIGLEALLERFDIRRRGSDDA